MTTRAKGSTWNSQDNFGYVSVKDKGALGDGSTDDTSAFNTALALGVPVFIPAGTYIVTPLTIPANTTIFGAGALSIVKMKAGVNGSGATLTIGSGTILRDFAVDGNKANNTGTTGHGIAVVNAVTSTIANVSCTNNAGDGINVSGSSTVGLNLTNCSANGFMRNGFTITDGTYARLTNCVAYSSDLTASPGDGFALAPTVGATNLFGATFTNCLSRSNIGRGFAFLGFGSKNVYDISVSNCIAASNTSHGFHALTAMQLLMTGNIAKANSGDGFRLEGDTQFCRVTSSIADGNSLFGMREIVAGSTPNNNKFIYDQAMNNVTSNTITVVGGASAVVS